MSYNIAVAWEDDDLSEDSIEDTEYSFDIPSSTISYNITLTALTNCGISPQTSCNTATLSASKQYYPSAIYTFF